MISVVTNLIDNAVKASRKESKIVLEATPDHLMVQDFGKGIPKEDLEMVTEPFYMVDKSRSRAKGSVGLGLSLCQKTNRERFGIMLDDILITTLERRFYQK